MNKLVRTQQEIQAMRLSGQILNRALGKVRSQITAGVSGKDLAVVAKSEIEKNGAKPAFLGYQGFPDVICVSINDEVVHGIPSDRILKDGDVVSIDCGVVYGRMITDSAFTLVVGHADKEVENLVNDTEAALYKGIDALRGTTKTGNIGFAIQEFLAPKGYGIVKDLVGHGVGYDLHEEPNIPNYGIKDTGFVLKPGMTVAIEPMATLGDYRVKTAPNGWTVQTIDGSMAAHFEHTVLITDQGAEILTKS